MAPLYLITFSGANGPQDQWGGCTILPDGVEDTDVPIAIFETADKANSFASLFFGNTTSCSLPQETRAESPGEGSDVEEGFIVHKFSEGLAAIHGQEDHGGFNYWVSVQRVEADVDVTKMGTRYAYVVLDVKHHYNNGEGYGGDELNVLLGVFGKAEIAKAYAKGFLRGRDYVGLREPMAVTKQRAIGVTTRIKPLVQKDADTVRRDSSGRKMDEEGKEDEEEEEEEGEDDQMGESDSDDDNRCDWTTARWVDIVKLELNSTRTK